MAWPELVIGFLALLEFVILSWLGMTNPQANAGSVFALLHAFWLLALPLVPAWVVLRAVDWLFAGPARRKRQRIIGLVP